MTSEGQSAQESYKVIILSRDGDRVLLARSGDQFVLPSVALSAGNRFAETLTAAVRTDWGAEVLCLFDQDALAAIDGTGVRYEIAEHWKTSNKPKAPTQWLSVAALSQDSSIDPRESSAIRKVVAQWHTPTRDSLPGPFARLGWFRELREWIRGVIEPQGLHLGDTFCQKNASPSFSLVRFVTDGPALWFKAVGEPNEREFPITCTLAQLLPVYLPPILATRPGCNGWLALEAEGCKLDETEEIALWRTAATTLARLQIKSLDHGTLLLSAGARDLRTVALSRLVQPFIETMTQLMEEQTKVLPAALNREELLWLGDSIQSALANMEAARVPSALGHLDLNPGNIIVAATKCVFLDWAEAYIGNPFLSFEYLLEHLRARTDISASAEALLIESYCAQWTQVIPPKALREALRLTPLLAVFAYATGNDVWTDPQRLREPATAGYLRSLARRMYREAEKLTPRRSACPH
ncbi:MAG: phosphotransferase [Candidatus Korobacteraceae bacterium]